MKNFVFHKVGENLYTPTLPASGQYQNLNLNSLASQYASTYGHGADSLISRVVRDHIFDAAPQQYWDLKILSIMGSEQVASDEIHYHEMDFGRKPVTLGTSISESAGASQSAIPVVDASVISVDTIVELDDDWRGTVTAVDTSANTIDVDAFTGETLRALTSADDSATLANIAPVEADGQNYISQYFRQGTIERTNYVQALVKGFRLGRMEEEKYKRAGTLSQYLAKLKGAMFDQHRIDIANVYWNGKMGEAVLADGQLAKTAGGIVPTMTDAGSPSPSANLANIGAAFEELVLDTEYGNYGDVRFFYATPRYILNLSKHYKSNLTRYEPENSLAKLGLSQIDIGSSRIVLVPLKRFEEPSCFPTSFRNRGILLDQKNLVPGHLLPEQMGQTLGRENNGTLQNYTDTWVSCTFTLHFYNPLACGSLTINELP